MIKRDIQPQWQRITNWFWKNYDEFKPNNLNIWDILKRDYGVQRTRPMCSPGWSEVAFPDEKSYTMFLLRWA